MSKPQKLLFVDRDGTMIKEPADEQIDSFEKLEFYPGAIEYLSKIANELDYELVERCPPVMIGKVYRSEIFQSAR